MLAATSCSKTTKMYSYGHQSIFNKILDKPKGELLRTTFPEWLLISQLHKI